MEHPLIGNLDSLTEAELLEKVTELNKKLTVAYRMGNAHLINQIQMAVESYQTKYTEKLRKATDDDGFADIIDVS
jgi:hypothetical protein